MIGLHFFSSRRERFLILDACPDRVNALIVSIDEEKHIRPERILPNVNPLRLAGYLKLGRIGDNIIIAADPALVYTATLPVTFARHDASSPVTAIETENMLSQAVGRFFNQCRSDAGLELGVDDLDVLLVNSRVLNFKVDGHHVLNPLDFRGRSIEAFVELTLTTRGIFENLKELLRDRKTFFFTESGRAELLTLGKLDGLPATFIALGIHASRVFLMQKASVGHSISRAPLTWRANRPRRVFAEALGVSDRTADEVYRAYLEGRVSPTARRAFEKLLEPTARALLAELTVARLKGPMYLSSTEPLPFPLPHRGRSFTLLAPSLQTIAERLGVSIDPKQWPMAEEMIFPRLAPFFEFYFAKSDSWVNRWLARHLNWLGASARGGHPMEK